MVFFVVLALAMLVILLLLFQLNKTRHRKLIFFTVSLITLGIFLLGYSFIDLSFSPLNTMNNQVLYISFGSQIMLSCAWCILLISVPFALFCLISKNNNIDEDLNL